MHIAKKDAAKCARAVGAASPATGGRTPAPNWFGLGPNTRRAVVIGRRNSSAQGAVLPPVSSSTCLGPVKADPQTYSAPKGWALEAYWRRTSAAALLGAKPETVGWGGRIRTSAWRNQNPLPYRLATPQQKTGLSARLTWCFGGAQVHALIPEMFEHIRDAVAIRLGDEFCRWAYLPDKAEDVAARVDGARPTWTDEIATMQDIPDAGDAKTYTSGFASLDQHGLRIVLPAFMPIIGPYASGESVLLRQLLFNLWRLHKWKFLLTSCEIRGIADTEFETIRTTVR